MNCVLHIFIFILYTNNINHFQVTKKTQLFDVQNLSETMRQTYNNYDFYLKKRNVCMKKLEGNHLRLVSIKINRILNIGMIIVLTTQQMYISQFN